MKYILSLPFFFLMLIGCSQSKTKPITEFSQNDIKNGILVDVRTPEEYTAGHIDNALNINWFDVDFKTQFDSVSKDEPIYLYCKMGGRSAKAQEKLKSLGFTNVINLEGGYDALKEKE
ncbi:rhodanese-like domain-containing protein [Aurantibacter crassamenti]|uniref:rhodanese-like domain-containing protein n=1 Tax=Aurantibacter crassamenti TaxID=1837375 RepID=UPI00193A7796|nr:rhodanese-like domain-containing protein [Aurantibacter crassamenti]MBM1106077.1 rhodanese-like domain-containing protein [Aurantibacter crassamenti]